MIERLIDGSAAFWPAVATHLWQSTLVLLVLALAARVLRGAPARLVCLFWWIALLKLFLPLYWIGRLGEAVAATWRGWLLSDPVGAADWGAVRVWFYPEVLQVTAGGGGSAGSWIYPALSAIWLGGVALVLLRGLRGREEHLPPVSQRPAERRLAAALEGTSIPRRAVRLGARSEMPYVRGWWRPRIHVSLAVIEALDSADLRAVLLHEDAHRRRLDPLRGFALRLAGALLFFYPPVWWLIRRIRETTEMACDETALAAGLSADEYAGALARTLRLGLVQTGTATAIHGRRSSLKQRFARLDRNRRFVTMNRHRIALAAAVLLVAAASFAPIIPAGNGPDDSPAPPHPPVVIDGIEGLDRSVDLNFKEARLEVVVDTLARRAGFEVELAPNLRREKISLKLDDVSVGEALAVLGRKVGLAYSVLRPGTLRIDRSPLLAGVGEVTNPTLIPESKVEPAYPESMRVAGIEGSVILQAVIDETGNVGELEVLRARPRDQADMIASALDAVRLWRYEPATLEGKPVEVYFTIFVQYSLNDKDEEPGGSESLLR